jgi:hypothetical protein
MLQSLTNGLGRLFGLRSTGSDDDGRGQSSNPRDQREGTRIGLAVAIEARRSGSDEVTIFARRLGPSIGFDYRAQFLSDGSVRFFFLTPPSLQVWKVMRYMDFQPEDRRNQTWVRKSGWNWSAKELVDTINFVHLVIHHGYVIPDQRYSDDR